MTETEIKEKIDYYFARDMMFSTLYFCEQLFKLGQTEYWRLRHAEILRLCGYHSKSFSVYLEIDIPKISLKHQYLYHLYFGQLLMDMGNIEGAQNEFKKCIEFKDCDTAPYIFISSLLSNEENNDDAIEYLKQALAKEGDVDEVYYNLATRFAMQGDFDKALNAIENCLKLDPDYPNATNWKNDFLERKNLN